VKTARSIFQFLPTFAAMVALEAASAVAFPLPPIP
jgi:hypothetical protein